MSELRDAIAGVLPMHVARREANAVLAMPELQAIRKALYRLATDASDELHPNVAEWLALYDLPPSVVAWVLSGETP